MRKPASRMSDLTNHPGKVIGGSSNVLIEGKAAARIQDPVLCIIPPSVGPHPPNPIVMGRTTILINNRMATTMTDITGCGSKIMPPCAPTVLIDGPRVSVTPRYGNSTVLNGSTGEIRRLAQILNNIAEAGPKGRNQVTHLNQADTRTEINIETGLTPWGHSVNNWGGGITRRGLFHNEIYINPDHSTTYRTESDPPGTQSGNETPEGLLSHEMGHAQCANEGAPSHSHPWGGNPENDVITRTNPVRDELGLPREHLQ
jgi:uncharacterized Zn-binding protein involved in type VI secretion